MIKKKKRLLGVCYMPGTRENSPVILVTNPLPTQYFHPHVTAGQTLQPAGQLPV